MKSIYTTAEIRQSFIDFFAHHGHTVVPSSSLIPGNDPTLLFTNAGMVQFKDVFLGQEKREYTRATSSQRCVRAGGKHNDLENVGYTARHHTFFEMLGNFSFGDYFKKEAIEYAWEYLTEVIQLPPERLWVTVYEKDEEAADIWLNHIKVSPDRFSRIGEKDNFWSMGETGPCGPCSEIFYDHGADVAGGPPGSADEDGDRYIEIWNLVFMQYNRDHSGTLTPLPKPSVDTGMGLERLAAILQNVHNNYDIDLFRAIIAKMAQIANCTDHANQSLRVIADHIRSCAFLIVDGVLPSNEGRGYVLRRIIRRAIRHGHKLGLREPFFYQLVDVLNQQMGQAYPELDQARSQVEKVLLQEEQRFAQTLEAGMNILETEIARLKDHIIPGSVAFKLYDTYGFPVDLTADIARERDLLLDMQGFEAAMERQRERARSAGHFQHDYNDVLSLPDDLQTLFCGYEHLYEQTSISGIYIEGSPVSLATKGDKAVVVLAQTPFYAESGGQVGDRGIISSANGCFQVNDTQKQGNIILHYGEITAGELKQNEAVEAQVNESERSKTAANHSATHLLHAALRKILGTHVQQKGSLVDSKRLRFDFSHFEAIGKSQLREIEHMVNAHIRANHAVQTRIMSLQEAKQSGAMALFGEKYGDTVRVLSMGQFSVELCGGTHVRHTGVIGLFKIVVESGVAAGVRRIEAVTAEQALQWVEAGQDQLAQVSQLLKTQPHKIQDKLSALLEQHKTLEKEVQQLQAKLAASGSEAVLQQAVEIAGIKVLAAKMDGLDSKALRDTLDQFKNRLGSCIVVLAVVQGEKISLIAGVSKDNIDKIKAGEVVNHIAAQVGGKGGGRPDMAMAGGNQPQRLQGALDSLAPWLTDKLTG